MTYIDICSSTWAKCASSGSLAGALSVSLRPKTLATCPLFFLPFSTCANSLDVSQIPKIMEYPASIATTSPGVGRWRNAAGPRRADAMASGLGFAPPMISAKPNEASPAPTQANRMCQPSEKTLIKAPLVFFHLC